MHQTAKPHPRTSQPTDLTLARPSLIDKTASPAPTPPRLQHHGHLSRHPNMPICHKPALHTTPLNLHPTHTHTHTHTQTLVDLHPAPVKNARFRSRLCRDYLMSLARPPASQAAPWCKIEKDREEEERERENAACGVGLCCAACRYSVLVLWYWTSARACFACLPAY
jgi:hypothetical protein